MLTVIVGSRHTIVQFSYLDADYNRIHVYSCPALNKYEEDDMNLGNLDDCNAEEFMTFLRWIDNGM